MPTPTPSLAPASDQPTEHFHSFCNLPASQPKQLKGSLSGKRRRLCSSRSPPIICYFSPPPVLLSLLFHCDPSQRGNGGPHQSQSSLYIPSPAGGQLGALPLCTLEKQWNHSFGLNDSGMARAQFEYQPPALRPGQGQHRGPRPRYLPSSEPLPGCTLNIQEAPTGTWFVQPCAEGVTWGDN